MQMEVEGDVIAMPQGHPKLKREEDAALDFWEREREERARWIDDGLFGPGTAQLD